MGERPDELSTAPSAPTPGTTHRPTLVDLDEELTRPRVSARRRAAQTGVVLAAVVVVVVGLLLHGIGPAQRQGTSVVQPLAPPTVLIESNVSFGTLTLNGQALHGSPPLLTARFHPGTNVVTLAAPPFAPKTCHFLLPSDHPSAETGCSGGGTAGGPIAIQGVSVVPDQILDIELGSAGLPPELAARASATALQAIAAVPLQMVVPVGQYYASGQDTQGHIIAQLASAPLQAQALFGLEMCGPSPFCPSPLAPGVSVAPGQRVWSVGLNLTANWDFTPPSGPAILSPPVQIAFPLQLFLAYDRTGGTDGAGGWRVVSVPQAAPPPNPGTMAALADQLPFALCQAGSSLLSGLLPSPSAYGFDTPYYRGIGGCMIQVVRAASSAVQGTFLWRFGVLLAVDTGAYRLVPGLPIAPQAEVAAVEG